MTYLSSLTSTQARTEYSSARKQTKTQLCASLFCSLCVNSPWVKHPDSAAPANSSWYSGPMCCKQMGHTGSLRGPYTRRKTSVNSGNQFGWKPKLQVSQVLFFVLFFYPSTCSCPFLTPSRKPCNSLARLPSTNFSRMQASKHQVNCHSARNEREKASLRTWTHSLSHLQFVF